MNTTKKFYEEHERIKAWHKAKSYLQILGYTLNTMDFDKREKIFDLIDAFIEAIESEGIEDI